MSSLNYQRYLLEAAGLSPVGPAFAYTGNFNADGGLLFTSEGKVVNPDTGALVASFPSSGLVSADAANSRVYFLSQSGSVWTGPLLTLRSYDLTTSGELWSISFPGGIGAATKLFIKLGTNGLAFCTDAGRVVIVRTSELSTPAADLELTASAAVISPVVGSTSSDTFTIANRGNWTASGIVLTNPLPAGLNFVSATSKLGSCIDTYGVVICSVGSLVNGASATVTVNFTPTSIGVFTNTANVTHSALDPVSTNNAASLVMTVTEKPTLTINDIAVPEGPSSPIFTLSLSAPCSQPVTVQFRESDGTAKGGVDYSTNGTVGTATFSPGTTNRTILLSGSIFGNSRVQSNRYFYMNLTNATNAVIGRNRGVCWIVEDDFYQISITRTNVLEGNSGFANLNFLFAVSPSNSYPVSVDYFTLDGTALTGTDYVPRAGTLSFPAGVTNKVLSVPIRGDSRFEDDETFSLNFVSPVSALVKTNTFQGTIINDDGVPPLAIHTAQAGEGGFNLWFNTVEGHVYRVERTQTLAPATWETIAEISGDGSTAGISDGPLHEVSSFYRLVLVR